MAPRTVAGETTANTATSTWEYLYEELLTSGDVEEFLDELAGVAAGDFSGTGGEPLCGIILQRQRKPSALAGSSAEARVISRIGLQSGNSPAVASLQGRATIHVPDLNADSRWPEYSEAARSKGVRSVLAIPFQLAEESRATLVLHSSGPGRFEGPALQAAEDFVHQTSLALRLAIRFAEYSDTAANLRATLESRTVIDMAVGIIMAQNRCSQQEAFELLRTASSTRNAKLHLVAAGIVDALGKGPARTHYDD